MKQESKAQVTGAAEKLVAFVSACERELTAEAVNGYLCDGFAELVQHDSTPLHLWPRHAASGALTVGTAFAIICTNDLEGWPSG